MVRPQYPSTYDEISLPLVEGIMEVSVGIDDVWKVGDLVDWLTDGCFWTGRLTQVFNDGNAEVRLYWTVELYLRYKLIFCNIKISKKHDHETFKIQ